MTVLILDAVIEPTVPRDVFYWVCALSAGLIGYLAKLVWNRAQSRADTDSDKINAINENMIRAMEQIRKIDTIEKDVQGLKRWQGVINERLNIEDNEDNNNE